MVMPVQGITLSLEQLTPLVAMVGDLSRMEFILYDNCLQLLTVEELRNLQDSETLSAIDEALKEFAEIADKLRQGIDSITKEVGGLTFLPNRSYRT